MPVDRAQQRVDVDEHPLIGTDQQIDPLTQRTQMLTEYGVELAGIAEGELPQQRSDGRGRIHRVAEGLHPATAHDLEIVQHGRVNTQHQPSGKPGTGQLTPVLS